MNKFQEIGEKNNVRGKRWKSYRNVNLKQKDKLKDKEKKNN